MNIQEKILFFITDFHTGNINRLLHLIGIFVMLYAIYRKVIVYAIVSIVIMELGHWYQYRMGGAGYKLQVKQVVNLQLVLIVVVLSVLSLYFYYF